VRTKLLVVIPELKGQLEIPKCRWEDWNTCTDVAADERGVWLL
jgi:hypothetical protein